MKRKITLKDISDLYNQFRRERKILTDLVLGRLEMETVRSFSYTSFPASKQPIPPPLPVEIDREILGINLHQLKNAESHFEGFDLSEESDDFLRFEKIELDK